MPAAARSPEVARLFHPPAFGVISDTPDLSDTGEKSLPGVKLRTYACS